MRHSTETSFCLLFFLNLNYLPDLAFWQIGAWTGGEGSNYTWNTESRSCSLPSLEDSRGVVDPTYPTSHRTSDASQLAPSALLTTLPRTPTRRCCQLVLQQRRHEDLFSSWAISYAGVGITGRARRTRGLEVDDLREQRHNRRWWLLWRHCPSVNARRSAATTSVRPSLAAGTSFVKKVKPWIIPS